MIQQGRLLATSANVPAYMGALLTTRLYDVLNGWQPRSAERLMNWRSVTMTKNNLDAYLERYVNNGDVAPFDFKRMSKVEHPEDWDPQAEVFPMDIDLEWGGIDKPAGWAYPPEYVESLEGGDAEATRKEYAEHYKIDFFGPVAHERLIDRLHGCAPGSGRRGPRPLLPDPLMIGTRSPEDPIVADEKQAWTGDDGQR